MGSSFKTRENRLRRLAKRQGLAVVKRDRPGFKFVYALVELRTGAFIETAALVPLGFSDIDGLEAWLTRGEASYRAASAVPYSRIGSYLNPE